MQLLDADWIRLERYVSRRGTPEELAELGRWVEGSAELRAIVDGMQWAGDAPAWDEEAAWSQVSRPRRCAASMAAQRISLEPCLVIGPRRTVVSDSRWTWCEPTP